MAGSLTGGACACVLQLAKTGQKNLDVGLGCGVGVGYGFGAGLFLKPGVGEGLMESAKEAWAGAQEQLHARYGERGSRSAGGRFVCWYCILG